MCIRDSDIILKPVITENSMAGIADKKYTFKVATDATKVEIAQAEMCIRDRYTTVYITPRDGLAEQLKTTLQKR